MNLDGMLRWLENLTEDMNASYMHILMAGSGQLDNARVRKLAYHLKHSQPDRADLFPVYSRDCYVHPIFIRLGWTQEEWRNE